MRRIAAWTGVAALVGLLVSGAIVSATQDPYVLVFYLSYASVGLVLVIRRPRNFLGWVLFFLAFGFITVGSSFPVDVVGLENGTATAASYLVVWTSAWIGGLVFTAYVALAVLFPTGRLPAPPWRWPAFALIAVGLVYSLVSAVVPELTYAPNNADGSITVDNPFAVVPGSAFWDVVTVDLLTVAAILMLAVAALGMLARYRRAVGLTRLQMRWLVAAVAAIVAAIVIGIVILAVAGEDADYAWIPAMIAYPLVPLAIGIAVLRYRLYEIDRIISRTIGWAVVSAVLILVFVVLVLGSTEIIEPLTGGNTIAVAASTLVVAALFAPLRSHVQRGVDRRFDRARYDGERTLAAFGLRVRDEVDLEIIRADVLATVDQAVRPATVGLWLRERGAHE